MKFVLESSFQVRSNIKTKPFYKYLYMYMSIHKFYNSLIMHLHTCHYFRPPPPGLDKLSIQACRTHSKSDELFYSYDFTIYLVMLLVWTTLIPTGMKNGRMYKKVMWNFIKHINKHLHMYIFCEENKSNNYFCLKW